MWGSAKRDSAQHPRRALYLRHARLGQNTVVTAVAIAALVFAAFGLASLVWSAWNVVQALDSRRWPAVGGVIVASQLQRVPTDGGFGYRPAISYRYEVRGWRFISSRIQFGDRLVLSWSRRAQRILQKYPVGMRVSVRYEPDDAEEAVLEAGIHGNLLAGIAFGPTFLAMAILAWNQYS
jgi:hypothetical protein